MLPLVGHLGTGFTFCEPCAGDGRLVGHLEELFDAHCFLPMDVEPNADWVMEGDANILSSSDMQYCEMIVTNPPFTWSVLKPLMEKFISLAPTLLLLPADFMHNKRMAPFLKDCVWIKSIRRVKWIEGSKATGVDNYCWYLFDKNKPSDQPTAFYGSDV